MSSSDSLPAPGPRAAPTILIGGAGRGLGHAMAEEFLARGWNVIGTVRPGTRRSKLHELAETAPGQVEIETLDINEPAQIAALRSRLAGGAAQHLRQHPPPDQRHARPAGHPKPAVPRLPRPDRSLVRPAAASGGRRR